MYKAELELEKRLNDIALANVPSTSYENIVVVPRFKHHTPLEMSPDEFDLRDLMLDQKMNVISMNAIVNKLGWKPSKIKTDVTKEMIADYQLEQMKNLKDGLYIPASLDLDLLALPDEILTMDEAEVQAGRANLLAISGEMDRVQGLIANLQYEKDARQNDLDTVLGIRFAEIDEPANGLNVLQRRKAKSVARRKYDNDFAEIERLKNRDEYQLRTKLEELSAAFLGIQRILNDNEQAVSNYQREVSEVQAENARRRRIYEDAVKSVNTGRNFVAMLPDETADEYKQRLRDIGDSTANTDAVQAAAGLLYTDRLREKMSEITRDDVLIGDFIRRLSTDERYSLVKTFELFKKKILEIFGVNNSNLSADDLVNIAEELADIVATRAIAEPLGFKEIDERDERPVLAFAVEEGSEVPATESEPPLGDYVLTEDAKILREERKGHLLAYANQGVPLPPMAKLTIEKQTIFDNELKRIRRHLNAKAKEGSSASRGGIKTFFTRAEPPAPPPAAPEAPAEFDFALSELQLAIQAVASDLADEDAKDRLLAVMTDSATGNPRTKESLIKVLKTSGFYKDVIARVPTRGSGMRGMSIKYPKIVPFGLIEVSPHKLFYENILKITRKGKHLTGFPNVKVSNDFVSFMFKVLEGEQPTLRDVNKLSVGEKQLFDSVVFTAGLQKKVESTGSGVKQKLKDRMALIEGEIEAGNTSDELIKEARQILQHLARMKIIGHRAAAGHLKQLINAQRG
jgi:hypothetical protein